MTPLPLFDAVPVPDGPGPGIVAKEGDAAQLNVREVAVPGGGERIPGPARDVMDSAIGSARRDAAAGLANGLQGDRGERLCSREDCGKPLTGRQSKWCSDACYWRVWDRANPRVKGRARQAALPGESRPERLFARWIETPEGQAITRMVRQFALERVRAGRRRGEINYLCAKVRDETLGLGKDEQGYAVNNTIRAHLARYLMEREPELAGWFETRTLRGRA